MESTINHLHLGFNDVTCENVFCGIPENNKYNIHIGEEGTEIKNI